MSPTKTPLGVLDSFKQRNVVVFVGSGLSAAAGLPTASALASSLAATLTALDDVDHGARQLRLDEIAEQFELRLGRPRLAMEVESQLATTSLADISPAHFLLASLVKHGYVRAIVTTNYDTLIEDACQAIGAEVRTVAHPNLIHYAGQRSTTILKLHGDFQYPDLLVLTPRDYAEFEAHKRRPLLDFMRTMVQSHPILFLGYSVNDSNFLSLLQQVRAELADSARPPSHAAVYDIETFADTEERLRQYAIRAFASEDTVALLFDILTRLKIKLRIGHLLFHYPERYPDSRARYGGIETFIKVLKDHSEHEHELLNVLTASMYRMTDSSAQVPADLVYPASFYYFRAATTAVVQELLTRRRSRPDVVHVHFLAFAQQFHEAGFPTLCTSHSLLSTDLAFSRGAFDDAAAPGSKQELEATRNAEKRACIELSGLTVFSLAHKEELVRLGAQSVSVMTAPFDPAPFVDYRRSPQAARRSIDLPERFTITYVGRPDRRKGLEILIEACTLLRQSTPDFQLMLVGFGFTRDRSVLEFALGRFAIDIGEYLGTGGELFIKAPGQNAGDVAPYYAASDIVVIPSIYEPMGYVVLEAMASARAIVAAETGGIPEEVTHGETGLLFRPGDAIGLAALLKQLHADPALRARLADNAHAKVLRRESPKASAQNFDENYRQFAFRARINDRRSGRLGDLERRIDAACEVELTRPNLTVHEAAMTGCRIAWSLREHGAASDREVAIDIGLYRLVAARLHAKLRSKAKVIAFPPNAMFEMMKDMTSSYLNADMRTMQIKLQAAQTRSRLELDSWFATALGRST